MDDNQYSYMTDQLERERTQHKPRLIRPLEEVMEEDGTSLSSPLESPSTSMRHLEAGSEMEVEADTRAGQHIRKESPGVHGAAKFPPVHQVVIMMMIMMIIIMMMMMMMILIPPVHQASPGGYFTPYVGIGRSGISPLVLSDPRVVTR